MKCVIAFSCLLAVASAGYLKSVAPLVPAHHGSHAVAYNAPLVSAPHHVHVGGYAGPLADEHAANTGPAVHAGPLATQTRLVDPIAIAAGAPLPGGDTVEVAAAKATHYQIVHAAKNLAHSGPIAHGYAHAAPLVHANHGSHAVGYNAPLISAPHPIHVAYDGPLAHAYAANTGPAAHAGPHATQTRLVDPIAIAAGAPLPSGDTVEVAAAKAAHYQAVHAVKAGHY